MPKDESCVPDECVKVAELQCDVELVCQAAQVRLRLHDPQATRAQGVGDCLGPCKGPCRSAWRVEPLQAGRGTHWQDVLEMVNKVYCMYKLEALCAFPQDIIFLIRHILQGSDKLRSVMFNIGAVCSG